MKLTTPDQHPHGLSHAEFESLFTKNKPVLFNFHAYAAMVEKLVFDSKNREFIVHGYKEEGTISTAFDMCVMNDVDRFHLVMDVCDLVEQRCTNVNDETKWTAAYVRQDMKNLLVKHKKHIREFGVDMPEVVDWRWSN